MNHFGLVPDLILILDTVWISITARGNNKEQPLR